MSSPSRSHSPTPSDFSESPSSTIRERGNTIKVALRIKSSQKDITPEWLQYDTFGITLSSKDTFQFDSILTPETTQTQVFTQTIQPYLDQDSTVLTYGDPDLGRTNTNFSPQNGIIAQTIRALFETTDKVEMSVAEIFEQKIRDLLDKKNKSNFYENLTRLSFDNPKVMIQNISNTAFAKRITYAHYVCNLFSGSKRVTFIDLARGQLENPETVNSDFPLDEEQNLTSAAPPETRSNFRNIIYRKSLLTNVVENILKESSYKIMISCISQESTPSNILSTLRYAHRVKNAFDPRQNEEEHVEDIAARTPNDTICVPKSCHDDEKLKHLLHDLMHSGATDDALLNGLARDELQKLLLWSIQTYKDRLLSRSEREFNSSQSNKEKFSDQKIKRPQMDYQNEGKENRTSNAQHSLKTALQTIKEKIDGLSQSPTKLTDDEEKRVPCDDITKQESETGENLSSEKFREVLSDAIDLMKSKYHKDELAQYDEFYCPMTLDCLVNLTGLDKNSFFLHIGSGTGLFGQVASAITKCISLGIEGDSRHHVHSARRMIAFYKLGYWNIRYLSVGPQNITNFSPATHLYLEINVIPQAELDTIANMFNRSSTCQYLLVMQKVVTPIQVNFKVKQNALVSLPFRGGKLVLRVFKRIKENKDITRPLHKKDKSSSVMKAYKILSSTDSTGLPIYHQRILEQHVKRQKTKKAHT